MHAVALLVAPLLAYLASRAVTAAAVRGADRVTAATRLRRANRLLQVAAGLGGIALATDSLLDDAVVAAVPGPDTAGLLVALAGTVAVGGVLPALSVHLGSRPAWATVAGREPDYPSVVRRYVVVAGLLTVPAFVVVAAWLAAPAGVSGLPVVAGAALAVVAGLPVAAAALGAVRRPTPAERAVVPECARDLRVRVVATDRNPVANAVAAGVVPGLRYVFVTDALFETLDDAAVAAVLAHEAGHHRRHHVLARFLATGLALAPLFLTASGVFDALLPATAASVGLLLLVGPAVRWTEYDADAYAADRVGAASMERALATLADRGLLPTDRPPLVGLVSLHPAVADRLSRLRDHNRF
ncbi:M48 family metalloprotease [Halobacterium litoreum]|uniref:M48 family metalloprotease n=1 Tax=Halobacterium litoreum TaxID=2039234 RepID=A0ABD5NI11_9EURY|nr:M48 family metalloprotease [Halobacterium litoreum]UHH12635.1 M48 family metalloprotease [Halobacterium litoreum]